MAFTALELKNPCQQLTFEEKLGHSLRLFWWELWKIVSCWPYKSPCCKRRSESLTSSVCYCYCAWFRDLLKMSVCVVVRVTSFFCADEARICRSVMPRDCGKPMLNQYSPSCTLGHRCNLGHFHVAVKKNEIEYNIAYVEGCALSWSRHP
jgi:hypothetical protein